MRPWRRHDAYVLRSFLAALGVAILFLTAIVVIYDLADRLGRLPDSLRSLEARGRSPGGVLVDYYVALVPFLWIKIIPVAALVAGVACVTWLSRQNEAVPLVTAGVPSRRVLLPLLVAGALLVGFLLVARETVVPVLSRRFEAMSRLLSSKRPDAVDRVQDVPHVHDRSGGRVSMRAYAPEAKEMENVWVTVERDPQANGASTAYRFPLVVWDEGARRWVAPRGGERRLLDPEEAGAQTRVLNAGERVPIDSDPALLELTLRRDAALGFSSAELSALAESAPEKGRFRMMLHRQAAAAVSTLVLLAMGVAVAWRVGRRREGFPAFVKIFALSTAFLFVDSVASDFGARGSLNPVVASWFADVVFGALAVALLSSVET